MEVVEKIPVELEDTYETHPRANNSRSFLSGVR